MATTAILIDVDIDSTLADGDDRHAPEWVGAFDSVVSLAAVRERIGNRGDDLAPALLDDATVRR